MNLKEQSTFNEKWRDVIKFLDSVPNGQSLKSKTQFSKHEIVQILGLQKKKIIDLEQLVKYESKKFENQMKEYANMVE